ncbi:16S rRNA (uracil(1498)-N(3))-methyltransferase [Campylobacter sp. RM16192]|uniref:16S rRNA (uracil(1498)-N(3))-methyltransferase n=1 Tax=Campylobacter sp. RM16192 TaxID=1660080 RepID=UPI001451BFB5|nr:16S rRNA (uracil(1498)-N(3))-methyltransferase [Campylobacter sp. RM16192]QCD53320.1 16S rRNA m3U1498 methyltransferase [Campylobacter sp. RM16192]
MKFLYSKQAGDEQICLQNEQFLHLKVRRAKLGERIDVRNLKDGQNYIYEITNLDKKGANLSLVFKHSVESEELNFNLGWAIIDTKVIEKTLPSLNEIGVGKLIFFYSDFSQKNFKIDKDRLERILISSCEQCGRNSIMQIEIYKNLDDVIKAYKDVALIDFGGVNFENYAQNEVLIIGPEGGFSQTEREKVSKKYSLNSKNILRSQTAILIVASKVLV